MTTNKRSTRYYSSKQERAVAKAVGGRQVANSGATMMKKGDVASDTWLLECKTKVKPSESISVKHEWITKNEEEAFAMGKEHSAVVINFGEVHGSQNYYIISEEEFLRLLNYERNDSDGNI